MGAADENALTVLAALVEEDRALNLEASALLLGIAPGTFRQLAAAPTSPSLGAWVSASPGGAGS